MSQCTGLALLFLFSLQNPCFLLQKHLLHLPVVQRVRTLAVVLAKRVLCLHTGRDGTIELHDFFEGDEHLSFVLSTLLLQAALLESHGLRVGPVGALLVRRVVVGHGNADLVREVLARLAEVQKLPHS